MKDEGGKFRHLVVIFYWLFLLVSTYLIWHSSTGYTLRDFTDASLPGQNYYLLSKLFGLYAIIFMALQVIYGLSKNSKPSSLIPSWTIKSHRLLGITTLLFLLLHAGFFIIAVSIRTEKFASNLLLPHFFTDFYHSMVSLGWLALVFTITAVFARVIHKRMVRKWVWFHRMTIPAIFLALWHAIMIGSETRDNLLLTIYWLLAIIIVLRLVKRMRQ